MMGNSELGFISLGVCDYSRRWSGRVKRDKRPEYARRLRQATPEPDRSRAITELPSAAAGEGGGISCVKELAFGVDQRAAVEERRRFPLVRENRSVLTSRARLKLSARVRAHWRSFVSAVNEPVPRVPTFASGRQGRDQ
jgi:hypothetical protein